MFEAGTIPFDVNCSILFTELPLLERPAASRSAGFSGIEFWWPFAKPVPADAEIEDFISSIQDSGLKLVGLNFFAGDMANGERGILSDPARSGEFRDNVDVAAALGARLGCTKFNALYGARSPSHSIEVQDVVAVQNLVYASRVVGAAGGDVLLEPLSGVPGYPLRSADDVCSLIDLLGREHEVPNVGFLCDVYHLAMNGDDPVRAIAKHRSRIGHVQLADAPGRGEPGTGGLPVESMVRGLLDAGYSGWIGLEYNPTKSSAESFSWMGHFTSSDFVV